MKLCIVACVVSFAFMLAVPSALAQADKLIGVWKLTEIGVPANPADNLEARAITDPQSGFFIFTKKHYSRMEVSSGIPRPDLPEEPTDAQIAAAYRQFRAHIGTYEVKGLTIMTTPILAKSPNLTNSSVPRSIDFRFEGDSLIMLFKPSPKLPAPYELKYIRLE